MQKGLAPILIVLLIALGIGGYFIYKINNPPAPSITGPVGILLWDRIKQVKPAPASPNTQPTPQPSPRPSGNVETANWKTYTNKESGYSFMYPQNFQVTTRDNYYYSFFTGKLVKEIVINKSRDDLSDWFEISISIDDNPQNLSANDVINNYLQKLKTISKTETEISSAKTITEKITKSLKPYKNGQIEGLHALFGYEYDYDIIVQTKNNKIYGFQYTGDNGVKVNAKAEKLVTQILSTFKFTN